MYGKSNLTNFFTIIPKFFFLNYPLTFEGRLRKKNFIFMFNEFFLC